MSAAFWLLLVAACACILFAVANHAGFLSNSIKIVRDESNYLELRAGWRTIAADKLTRTITVGKSGSVSFYSIRAIEIKIYDSHDGAPFWTVSLCLPQYKRWVLGKTGDDSEASIAAARLSTIIGRAVRTTR